MDFYTVTTRLDNHKFLVGFTDNPVDYVKDYYPQAEFVKNGINDTVHYKYFGGMGDEIELVFTRQTKNTKFHISLLEHKTLWL